MLRALPDVGRLRRGVTYHAIRAAIDRALARADFRVVHVSIQHNHVHLIVEADDQDALIRGIQGLTIAMARRTNAALGRHGRFFAHRYHATAITTPKQARAVLAYVLNNWRRHREDERTVAARRAAIDPYASGIAFDGWRDAPLSLGLPADYQPLAVARPTTWLLTTGWRRHRALSVHEQPASLAPSPARPRT